jgi:hypothetical protein
LGFVFHFGFAVALFLIVSRPGQDEAKALLRVNDADCAAAATFVDGLKAPDDWSSSLLSQ